MWPYLFLCSQFEEKFEEMGCARTVPVDTMLTTTVSTEAKAQTISDTIHTHGVFGKKVPSTKIAGVKF